MEVLVSVEVAKIGVPGRSVKTTRARFVVPFVTLLTGPRRLTLVPDLPDFANLLSREIAEKTGRNTDFVRRPCFDLAGKSPIGLIRRRSFASCSRSEGDSYAPQTCMAALMMCWRSRWPRPRPERANRSWNRRSVYGGTTVGGYYGGYRTTVMVRMIRITDPMEPFMWLRARRRAAGSGLTGTSSGLDA